MQQLDAEEARRKLEEKQERDMRERRHREARELERVKREEYTRMTKDRIVGQLNAKIDASKQALVINKQSFSYLNCGCFYMNYFTI